MSFYRTEFAAKPGGDKKQRSSVRSHKLHIPLDATETTTSTTAFDTSTRGYSDATAQSQAESTPEVTPTTAGELMKSEVHQCSRAVSGTLKF